jgi:hypothetical protein
MAYGEIFRPERKQIETRMAGSPRRHFCNVWPFGAGLDHLSGN